MIIKIYDSMFYDPMFYHFFITRHLFLTKEKRKFVCTIEKGVTERVCQRSHSGSGKTRERTADGGQRTANGERWMTENNK